MARAFSTLPFFPLTISSAVCLTMPSVGNRSEACVNFARTAFSSGFGFAGFDRSTAMSRVAKRLVCVRTGRAPSGHSAQTIPAPYLPSVMIPEVPPSAVNVLSSVLWYGVSAVSGVGTQTRVTPTGFRTSTRVVTSKMRHLSAAAAWANADGMVDGRAMPAEAKPVKRRKSRRSMGSSCGVSGGANSFDDDNK